MVYDIFLWIHLLLMVGTFGGLLFAQCGVPREIRDSEAFIRSTFKLGSVLIILALLAGVAVFILKAQQGMAEGTAGVVLVKFVIWLVVAGCFMTGASKAKQGHVSTARTMRIASLILLAIASFVGVAL